MLIYDGLHYDALAVCFFLIELTFFLKACLLWHCLVGTGGRKYLIQSLSIIQWIWSLFITIQSSAVGWLELDRNYCILKVLGWDPLHGGSSLSWMSGLCISLLLLSHISFFQIYPALSILLLDFVLNFVCQQLSPFEEAPEEFDMTIFSVQKDRTIGPVEQLALNLVKDAQR